MTLPPACPVLADRRRLTALAAGMLRALRRLTRASTACRTCAADRSCPIQHNLDAVITSAIADLHAEWARLRPQDHP